MIVCFSGPEISKKKHPHPHPPTSVGAPPPPAPLGWWRGRGGGGGGRCSGLKAMAMAMAMACPAALYMHYEERREAMAVDIIVHRVLSGTLFAPCALRLAPRAPRASRTSRLAHLAPRNVPLPPPCSLLLVLCNLVACWHRPLCFWALVLKEDASTTQIYLPRGPHSAACSPQAQV
jgi:hypothetical protein